LQYGHVSLYNPDNENLSGHGFLCLSRFSKVLLVRNVIFRSVCLNEMVIYVSLLMYVKVAHLCLEVCVDCCHVILLRCCLYGKIGNELLCRMLCMILSSFSYSSSWRLYKFSLL